MPPMTLPIIMGHQTLTLRLAVIAAIYRVAIVRIDRKSPLCVGYQGRPAA